MGRLRVREKMTERMARGFYSANITEMLRKTKETLVGKHDLQVDDLITESLFHISLVKLINLLLIHNMILSKIKFTASYTLAMVARNILSVELG